jgi:hypothetical protein
MSAMLSADYRDRTISALEDLREVFKRRYEQAKLIAAERNEAHDFVSFESAFGMMQAYHVALDDVAVAIQKEQGR